MRINELLELTGLLAVNGPLFVEMVPHHPQEMLEQYWTASRCRANRWVERLYESDQMLSQVPQRDRAVIWDSLEPTAVEVLATDVLTRLWGTLLILWDEHNRSDEATPIARSCYVTHLEARNRVLHHMVKWRDVAPEMADRWNRLRRTTERTTDMLLATLPKSELIESMAFDSQRVELARREWHQRFYDVTARAGAGLLSQALMQQLDIEYPGLTGNLDLNSRISSAILGCLHQNMFASAGQLRSLWHLRLYSTVTDVELMVHDAMESEGELYQQAESRWRKPDQHPKLEG